jgi:hypothetical protein
VTGTDRPSRREFAIALLVGLALIAVLTYPLVPGLLHWGRIDSGDGRYSIWNVGWIDHALLTDPRHLLDANIFFPHTGTLAYSELNLVAGVLGLPAFAITGSAIAAHNLAVVLGLLLAFVGTWALVRRITGSAGAGLVSATAFTFCPFIQAHTAHIQLLMAFAVPLVLVAYHRFRARETMGRAAALGAALAIAGLACAYYGIFAGLALGFVALLLGRMTRRYAAGLVVAAGITIAIVAPVFVPYLRARALVAAPTANSPDAIRAYSATAGDYLSSPSFLHEHLPFLHAAAESVFPGLLLLALAAVGLVEIVQRGTSEERRVGLTYAALAVIAAWASFGPGAGLYRVLAAALPPMGLLRAPVRLGLVVVLALAVVAGFGVRRLARGRRGWVSVALVPLVALELATLPWPLVREGPVSEVYRVLAHLPRGGVVEFPFMYRRADYLNHSRYMFNSIYHWQPLVNGYSDVVPPDFRAFAGPINAFPDPASFALMRRLGVKYVIWHLEPSAYDAESKRKILARLPPYADELKLLVSDGETRLYEIK